MKHNFLVRARHVPGVHNEIADALSRSGSTIQGTRSRCRPNPLYHPAFIHDPLKDEVLKYANWALSWNTNRTYTSGEKRFIQFCLMNRLGTPTGDILPSSEGTLIYFASYLARTVRHGTIKTYLAAVRNLLIISGYKDPLRGRLLLKKDIKGNSPLSRVCSYTQTTRHSGRTLCQSPRLT